jgi:transposase
MVGVTTNVVTSIEATTLHGADYAQFATLLNTTARKFEVKEVSADKAYLGTSNLEAAEAIGAFPFIPFKSNSSPRNKSELWRKHYAFQRYAPEEFALHYHKRSNVETTFAMIKAKFGGFVRSKTTTAQINEVLCKVLCHNLCCLVHASYEDAKSPLAV